MKASESHIEFALAVKDPVKLLTICHANNINDNDFSAQVVCLVWVYLVCYNGNASFV